MANASSYPIRAFSESQTFLVIDPSTGTTSRVRGSDLIAFITPNLNVVRSESSTDGLVNEDYRVGSVIQTTGQSVPGDGQGGLFLVVPSGKGDVAMLNGNDLLTIAGDAFLRTQLNDGIVRFDSLSEMESTAGRFDADAGRLVSGTGRDGDFRSNASDLSGTLVLSSVTSTSVDSGTDTITSAGHGLVDGDGVVLQAAVNGLSLNTVYWVVNATTDTFQLSSTFGGSAFDLTGTTNFTVDNLIDPGKGVYVTASDDLTGVNGAWVRQSEFVRPEFFEQPESALHYASNAGVTLILKDEVPYTITEDVNLSGGLIMKGRGQFRIPENVDGIVIEPSRSVSTTVSAVSTVEYPSGTGIEESTSLTVASASGFSVNDICQLRSDDTYTFNSNIRRAQLVKINAISGTTIYLAGNVKDTFSTNIVLEKLSDAVVDIDGPEFVYDGDPLSVSSKTRAAALTLIGCVSPDVKAVFHDDVSDGLRMFSCWEPDIDARCYDLRNNVANSIYGYGVAAYGSCFGGQVRVIADNCRHAYTDGVWLSSTLPIRDGRCLDMRIYNSVATNCTYASFDTHAGSVNTRFVNCGAIFNITNDDQPSRNNSYAFQDRALNTKFIDCWSYGCRNPFFFAALLTDYGEDNTTEVVGGRFERFKTSSSSFCGIPTQTSADAYKVKIENCKIIGFVPAQSPQTSIVSEYKGVEFIGDGSYGFSFLDNNGGMDFYDCLFYEFLNIRFGQDNTFRFIGCRRYNSGSNIEPLSVDVGSTAVIHDYFASAASYGFGEVIRAGEGSNAGTVTIKLGKVYAENFTSDNPVGDNGVATLTIENMDVRQAPVQKGATGSRPVLNAADIGFLYLDTTLDADGKPIWWNGTAWVDATGATV